MAIMRYKLIKKQYDKNRNKTPKMLKINENIKSVCFHVTPYIHSPVKGFQDISVATKTMFPGSSLISSIQMC